MDQKLKNARMQVASEIGTDIGYFAPPEEKRFVGIELMVGIGGVFLSAFFTGLAQGAGKTLGEHLGKELGEYISTKFNALFGTGEPAQDLMLEDSKRAALDAISRAKLTKEQVNALAVAIEAELTKVLTEQAPPDVSARIAGKVAVAAVSEL